ncbi:NAD(P)H-hydrate dehydratase [Brevundimonas intermedia]|uniref:ADP-dependent (S)-NAD(P)H-hydrate dehydratase n=1 Tax=Brevundimonas intermedia TaxID=74315 RepID=A0A4Y9S403_9CAUL|nr:NAD(P)H-hydrate dehydratase [Brevundimonas intermedia]TFW14248.1 NAD(P)H-hydrate dehydratase [Brevundimonas intermedia]
MTTRLDASALSRHPLPRLPENGDKEDRGAVLVVGGEAVMAGAAILAGVAALRAGAGKLQIRTDRASAAAVAVAVPEARIVIAPAMSASPLVRQAVKASALVLGPGMDTGKSRRRLASRLLESTPSIPAVIDAGAMPVWNEAAAFAARADGRIVMTPHAGEMAAILNRDKDDIRADPLGAAREAAAMFRSVVVMKGATTFVVSPDGMAWRHDGGVAGLGTSGSGDVLAGTIGGILARGAPPAVAALWGVVLHAEAGSELAATGAPLGFLARELPGRLPFVLDRLCPASDAPS